jgi:hypothetical protein
MGSLRTLHKDKYRDRKPDVMWILGPGKLYIKWTERTRAGLTYLCRIDYVAGLTHSIELILREPIDPDTLRTKFVSAYKENLDFKSARNLITHWYMKIRAGDVWDGVIDFPSCWEKDTHWGNYGWSRDFIIEEILNRYCRVYSGLS